MRLLISRSLELWNMLQAATLVLHVMASFLNNSSSRWEAICESWGVKAEMVDNVSPIYRSDQQRYALQSMLAVWA